jgi:hypothetical protein
MGHSHRFKRAALMLVLATLLTATACTSPMKDTWHLHAQKGTAAVGEHIKILPADKQLTRGCAGFANEEFATLSPQELDWDVAPSTGRVVGDYFVADELGTYKLTPVVSARATAAGIAPGTPLGPTMTIAVLPGEAPSAATTGGDVQASMDAPESSADAPLAGTWTYSGIVVHGTGKSATWSESPKPGTLVIERRADGYYLQISEGTSVATLDGANVVLERNFPGLKVSVRYTGVLSGDTITGTQHTVAQGATHDDPWTATRVK